ncbi:hypothetical protein IG631_23572 [Alternaria alternata]|nr:hypothetical protein IG631_23572 [Alternaria alternata]
MSKSNFPHHDQGKLRLLCGRLSVASLKWHTGATQRYSFFSPLIMLHYECLFSSNFKDNLLELRIFGLQFAESIVPFDQTFLDVPDVFVVTKNLVLLFSKSISEDDPFVFCDDQCVGSGCLYLG